MRTGASQINRAFQLLAAIAISGLLFYTGLHKWWYLPSTILKLHSSPVQWVSQYATLIAWTLPGLEIAIATAILFPTWRKVGFVSAGILFSAFTAYLISLNAAPPGTVCSCGGFIGSLSLRNHLLLVGIAWCLSIAGSISIPASSSASIFK